MKQCNFSVNNLVDLQSNIRLLIENNNLSLIKSILVQAFFARTDTHWIQTVISTLHENLPSAVVVGATTVGEILEGKTCVNSTVIAVSLFECTQLMTLTESCSQGNERSMGLKMAENLCGISDVKGVLMLSTTLSTNSTDFFQGWIESGLKIDIFGGGAGDYAAMQQSFVFIDKQIFDNGVIAVAFIGKNTFIESETYLGWHPLSKQMTITASEGLEIKTVDHAPAFSVYQRYLDITEHQQFFLNVLEFPFLLIRDDQLIARVPIAVTKDGGLQFIADIQTGETFQVGYGDIEQIIANAQELHRKIGQFCPEAIFLYSCGCRRFLMQENTELETRPYEEIAPSAGFYTYGEIYGKNGKLHLLNSAIVAVGIKETPATENDLLAFDETKGEYYTQGKSSIDPYMNQHAKVISRLAKFMEACHKEQHQEIHNQTQLMAKTIDAITLPTIIINHNQQIVHQNSAAIDFLQHNDCNLAIKNQKLSSPDPVTQKMLTRIIHQALAPNPQSGAFAINTIHGQLVVVTPLDAPSTTNRYAIIAFPDNQQNLFSVYLFSKLHRLTVSETEVATALYAGFTPKQIAESKGVSIRTVRTHISSLFKKTQTRNQVELALKINKITPIYEQN